jgi:hypothetical protein
MFHGAKRDAQSTNRYASLVDAFCRDMAAESAQVMLQSRLQPAKRVFNQILVRYVSHDPPRSAASRPTAKAMVRLAALECQKVSKGASQAEST